jgi:hypothetical protein
VARDDRPADVGRVEHGHRVGYMLLDRERPVAAGPSRLARRG